jgi:hypothetical protein
MRNDIVTRTMVQTAMGCVYVMEMFRRRIVSYLIIKEE